MQMYQVLTYTYLSETLSVVVKGDVLRLTCSLLHGILPFITMCYLQYPGGVSDVDHSHINHLSVLRHTAERLSLKAE